MVAQVLVSLLNLYALSTQSIVTTYEEPSGSATGTLKPVYDHAEYALEVLVARNVSTDAEKSLPSQNFPSATRRTEAFTEDTPLRVSDEFQAMETAHENDCPS